ncbi:hypothetical protein EDD15DRAFT_2179831 [Pisolithus albus]|nr:hypothetical protein EDD15DRAFT_2179831 [Pisolithus albus]
MSILGLKQKTPIETLCSGLPRELATFLTYARTLSFSEEPDNGYMRSLFETLWAAEGLKREASESPLNLPDLILDIVEIPLPPDHLSKSPICNAVVARPLSLTDTLHNAAETPKPLRKRSPRVAHTSAREPSKRRCVSFQWSSSHFSCSDMLKCTLGTHSNIV